MQDFVLVLAGRAGIVLASVVGIRLLTTFLSPVEVGRYNLILGLAFAFIWIVISPVGSYFNRHLIEWSRAGLLVKQTGKFVMVIVGSTAAAIAITAGLRALGLLGLDISLPWLAVAMVACVLTANLCLVPAGVLNLLGKRMYYVLIANLAVWIGLGASVALVMSGRYAEQWILGSLLGQLVATVIGFAILVIVVKGQRSEPGINAAWTGLLSFALPLVVFNVLYWGQTQAYRFVLDASNGLAVVGLFTAGFAVGVGVLAAFDQVITQYYNPIFYEGITSQDEVGQARAWNNYAAVFLPTSLLMVAYCVGLGPYLGHLLTGPAFAGTASKVVGWGAVAEATRGAISLTSLVAHARQQTRTLLLSSVIGVSVSLAGVLVLGRLDPYVGTGAALVIGAVVWLALLYLAMKRLVPTIALPRRGWAPVIGMAIVLLLPLGLPWSASPTFTESAVTVAIWTCGVGVMQYRLARSR